MDSRVRPKRVSENRRKADCRHSPRFKRISFRRAILNCRAARRRTQRIKAYQGAVKLVFLLDLEYEQLARSDDRRNRCQKPGQGFCRGYRNHQFAQKNPTMPQPSVAEKFARVHFGEDADPEDKNPLRRDNDEARVS